MNRRVPQDNATEDLFEMANLYPDTTGLPMTVWISPRGNARHDVRVKVNMTHGNQMTIANTAVVGVRPAPRVIAGQLSPGDNWPEITRGVGRTPDDRGVRDAHLVAVRYVDLDPDIVPSVAARRDPHRHRQPGRVRVKVRHREQVFGFRLVDLNARLHVCTS